MSKNSIIPLVTQWELFISTNKSTSLRDFAEWLLKIEEANEISTAKNKSIAYQNEEYLAANYLSRLNKYVRAYVKPLFHDNELTNSDEFSILSIISQMDRPTKREVCMANLMELSTGIDMIRRLLKAKYIKEEPHENDARAKRLSLTELGQEVLLSVYGRLAGLEQKVLADLTKKEKLELLRIMDYLNKYHENIYNNID